MNLSKSIDFLLEKAGGVIQYRLRKEILHNLTAAEEENLLEQIYQTPYFKLVQSYAKPSGYIGVGMHGWDNWRGVKLHETPLQDGETAARLLSYYAVPKSHPLVKNFVAAIRDENILRDEFSYIPPEISRYETRYVALNSGFCLMTLIYTMQAMIGYGDDEGVLPFQNVKEKYTMNELNRAAEILNRLHNVRIVYIPPMTMAAVCEKEPEKAWLAANDFVRQNNLLKIKPDLRIFRFEHANATGQNFGGFEVWVSIPDDFVVCAPIVKKKFLGGQYAAHVTGDSGFETWLGLQDWVNESDKYQYDAGLNRTDPPVKEIESFGGMRLDLEEVLNYQNDQNPLSENQFDLLLSVKNYEVSKEVAQEIPNSKEKCGFKASVVTKNKFRIRATQK